MKSITPPPRVGRDDQNIREGLVRACSHFLEAFTQGGEDWSELTQSRSIFVATTDPRNESAERIKGVIWRPFNARMHNVHS